MKEYLTQEKKERASIDFYKFVEESYDPDVHDGFMRSHFIEDLLKGPLKAINKNPRIHTLWSTRKKGMNLDTSYVLVWYSEGVESKIITEILPFFDQKYNNEHVKCTGQINPETQDKRFSSLAYFKLALYSEDEKIHDDFWIDLRAKLINLYAI